MSDHSQDNFERLQNLNVSQFLEKLSSFFSHFFYQRYNFNFEMINNLSSK